jgi:membrane protein DedA with SNARE-associated domain
MDLVALITQIISTAKYPVIFLMFFIDGSSTNFIASTLAGNGLLNIWIIGAAAIIIELCVDMFYFLLGRKVSDAEIIKKFTDKKKSEFIKTIDTAYKAHPGLTLMVIKFAGPLAIPGILYMGKVKALTIPKFLEYAVIVAGTRAILLSFIGYMVGKGVGEFIKVYDVFKTLGIVVLIAVIIFVIYKTYQKRIEKWVLNIFKKIK